MIKKAIFMAVFLLLIINLVSSVDINLISPQQGDVKDGDIYPQINQFCDVNWDCTKWGECVKGYRNRVCVDTNNCEYKYNVPSTKAKCSEEIKLRYVQATDISLGFWGFISAILLVILLIILLGLFT